MSSTIATTETCPETDSREREVTRLTERLVLRTEELLAAHEALRSLSRMKLEFLQLVSHEMRTPLTSILALSEFLSRYPFSSRDEVRELATSIRAEGLRLTRFVEDTIEYLELRADMGEVRPVPIRFAEAIDHVVSTCRANYASRNLDVRVRRPDDLVLIADSRLIHKTLTSLIDNAMKFSLVGGVVEISAGKHGEETDDRWIVTRIRDHGEGVPAERLGQLFDPFALCHPYDHHTRGWGLSLARALQVARVHGGHVSVASEGSGKGCEVVLRLPERLDGVCPSPGAPAAE